jgi:formylglycine-generating enzyme required for sulfatase activity
MTRGNALVRGLSAAAVVCWAVVAQATVTIDFVTVGNPGNAADTRVMTIDGTTGYGSVPYVYQMGKYDVTTAQYCQFLNAVAKTDTYGLYYSGMPYDMPTVAITQSGSSGNYSYSVTGGYNGTYSQAANCPVFDVSWGDAARFCNWLQNGQPTGPEGNGTTETGAYTLNGAVTNSALMAITRNAGATYVIPSENEWYKAAYYNPSNGSYWLYPTQSNTAPSNVLSATGTNNANYYDDYGIGNGGLTDPTNRLTPVGAFAASPGPYGTYDMGGDVYQWNEAKLASLSRGVRGGSWVLSYPSNDLVASGRTCADPMGGGTSVGFRVASEAVPEPCSLAMLAGIAVTALLYWWRKRA